MAGCEVARGQTDKSNGIILLGSPHCRDHQKITQATRILQKAGQKCKREQELNCVLI